MCFVGFTQWAEGGLALVVGEREGAGLAMVSVAKVEDEGLVV